MKKQTKKEPTWDQIGKAIGKEIEKNCKDEECKPQKRMPCGGGGGAFYGLGVLGAAIYYISTATGFWIGVLGVLKALIWPVFLVYGLLKFIGM